MKPSLNLRLWKPRIRLPGESSPVSFLSLERRKWAKKIDLAWDLSRALGGMLVAMGVAILIPFLLS